MESEIIARPCIADKAPEFIAVRKQGNISFPKDYSGNWIILLSHPADFTPVSTSEFMTLESMQNEFTDLNTQLAGLSIDGLYSYIDLFHSHKEKIEFRGNKNVDVTFPLIEDITLDIAKKYWMIQPDKSKTKAVRAVIFADHKGIIRTIIYYPLSLCRNLDELKRVISALQTTDACSVETPANWNTENDVIVSMASSCGPAKERIESNNANKTCYDWFFCTKKLSLGQVIIHL